MLTLWCKNNENLSDGKSHTWRPVIWQEICWYIQRFQLQQCWGAMSPLTLADIKTLATNCVNTWQKLLIKNVPLKSLLVNNTYSFYKFLLHISHLWSWWVRSWSPLESIFYQNKFYKNTIQDKIVWRILFQSITSGSTKKWEKFKFTVQLYFTTMLVSG